ncbi:MAG: hypothetical protein KC910_12525 [Candidatus Eremiobacteraeota bacterium]|nr:hypothetical protein [Candidatus Eremiobacteraeota bacterium]
MKRPSQLEQFLASQQEVGLAESQGAFTIARDEALRKLASFRLPFERAWVLKIVQAAVASGAPSLDIKQTSTDTEFHFTAPKSWTLDRLEEAFFTPNLSGDRALDHLMAGLWGASLNDGRPFQLLWPGCPESLIWSGREMTRITDPEPVRHLQLVVSHRRLEEGKGIFGIRNIQAAQRNADILKTLTHRAFTCSIPLRVDARRMDALQLSPNHGYGKASHPVSLGWAPADDGTFVLPPGTFAGVLPSEQAHKQEVTRSLSFSVERPAVPNTNQVIAAWLMTTHFEEVKSGKSKTWELRQKPSKLYWVHDGVILGSEELFPSDRSVSIGVFADVGELKLDLTGFGIIHEEAHQARKQRVLQAAAAAFEAVPAIPLSAFVENAQESGRKLGTVLAVGGVLTLALSPLHSLMFLAGAAFTYYTAGNVEAGIESGLQSGLAELRDEYQSALVSSKGP